MGYDSAEYTITKSESLEIVLSELKEKADTTASLILTMSGLVIKSDIPAYINEDTKVAGFIGMMTKSAEKAVDELGHAPLEYILLKINEGHIIIMNAGQSALLAALTGENIGISLIEMKKASRKIENLV